MFERQRIHQIWISGEYSDVPEEFRGFAEDIIDINPYWRYYFWGKRNTEWFISKYFSLLEEEFPGLTEAYNGFKYWIQKVDLLKLLILYVEGGVYIDLDVESFEKLELTFRDDTLYFAEEHPRNAPSDAGIPFVSNFLMGVSKERNKSIAYLIKRIVRRREQVYPSKFMEVMSTTGPIAMNRDLYEAFDIHYDVIPYTIASPLSKNEVEIDDRLSEKVENNDMTDDDWQMHEWLTSKMCRGYFYHHYAGGWLKED